MRFGQRLKSRFLKRENLYYWGLSDYTRLNELHNEFLNLDKKLSVSAMDFETISDQLIRFGVVETTRSANTTAMYAVQWMCGQSFDFRKSQIQIHRARLRKIGIDITQRFNLSKFSQVFVKEIREVKVADCPIPDWYQMPQIFKLALWNLSVKLLKFIYVYIGTHNVYYVKLIKLLFYYLYLI